MLSLFVLLFNWNRAATDVKWMLQYMMTRRNEAHCKSMKQLNTKESGLCAVVNQPDSLTMLAPEQDAGVLRATSTNALQLEPLLTKSPVATD